MTEAPPLQPMDGTAPRRRRRNLVPGTVTALVIAGIVALLLPMVLTLVRGDFNPGRLLGEPTAWENSLSGADIGGVLAGLSNGHDPNEVIGADGDSRPLVEAAYGGDAELIRVLLEAGATPDLPAPKSFTPLQAAAYAGHTSVASVLLAAGADPCLRSKDRDFYRLRPSQVAEKSTESWHDGSTAATVEFFREIEHRVCS